MARVKFPGRYCQSNQILLQPQPENGILFPLADKPAITNISPSLASAGTNSVVTISGSNFGTVQGEVWFRATGSDHPSKPNVVLPASILSWSATQIRCYVPRGVVDNYAFSAGSFSQAVYVVQMECGVMAILSM